MTAGMTLTGPSNSSLEDPPYKKQQPPPSQLAMPPSSSPPPLSLSQSAAPPSYKLPPDLELSKADDDGEEDVEEVSSASAHNHKNRQVLLDLKLWQL